MCRKSYCSQRLCSYCRRGDYAEAEQVLLDMKARIPGLQPRMALMATALILEENAKSEAAGITARA